METPSFETISVQCTIPAEVFTNQGKSLMEGELYLRLLYVAKNPRNQASFQNQIPAGAEVPRLHGMQMYDDYWAELDIFLDSHSLLQQRLFLLTSKSVL